VHALQLVARDTPEESIAARLGERTERIRAAFDGPSVAARGLQTDAEEEAARVILARSLSGTRHTATSNKPLVTVLSTDARRLGSIWAFRLTCVDESGQAIFETIAGLHNPQPRLEVDAAIERRTAQHHQDVLASTSAVVATWLDRATEREEAIVDALHASHARISAALLQPGLFDRRAERAAAAQASRLDEALGKSRARLMALARARRLRAEDPTLVFGVMFRP
jgi:hypothetical protein